MEDVYVIKVKTKPALATLYPSERRYSASTVGGLSLVHIIFGFLGLLLGCIETSVQGIVLFVGCVAPLISGILAWKRWYIDRNITIFFYCNIFSAAISTCCFIGSLYGVSMLTEKVVFEERNVANDIFYNQTLDIDAGDMTSESTTSFTLLDVSIENDTERTTTFDGIHENERIDVHRVKSQIFLMINIVVACLFEFAWSCLSIMISLKGIKNDSSDDGRGENNNGDKKTKLSATTLSSRPDIILMNKHICCSMQSLDSLQSMNIQNMYPKLPLPESHREYKERVDKFLTNQIHHRTVTEET